MACRRVGVMVWASLASMRLLVLPAGSAAQCCGDCNQDGRVTVDELVTAVNRGLGGCRDDGACTVSIAACTGQLTQCQSALASCQSQPSGQRLPATGQLTSYAATDDGAVRAGAALHYQDNGDGTITDLNTGLMWEKKVRRDGSTDASNLHDADNCYRWAGVCSGNHATPCGTTADCATAGGSCQAGDCQVSSPDGMTIFQWVAAVNAARFAGYNDWRVPNVKELESIVDYEHARPSVSTAFNGTSCGTECSNLATAACSCTTALLYWSSSTYAPDSTNAWGVYFSVGSAGYNNKGLNLLPVRAVRGGS